MCEDMPSRGLACILKAQPECSGVPSYCDWNGGGLVLDEAAPACIGPGSTSISTEITGDSFDSTFTRRRKYVSMAGGMELQLSSLSGSDHHHDGDFYGGIYTTTGFSEAVRDPFLVG